MKGPLVGVVAVLALGGCAQEKPETPEDVFVRHMRQVAIPNTTLGELVKDRDALLEKGHAACEGIAIGKHDAELVADTGLAPVDDYGLVLGARRWLCPST